MRLLDDENRKLAMSHVRRELMKGHDAEAIAKAVHDHEMGRKGNRKFVGQWANTLGVQPRDARGN